MNLWVSWTSEDRNRNKNDSRLTFFLYSVFPFSLKSPLRPLSADNFIGFWFWEFCVWEKKFTSGAILNVIWLKCFHGAAVDHWSYSIELIHKKHHTLFQFLNSFIWSKANPFPILQFSLSDSAKKSTTLVSAWIFGWGFWNFSSSKLQLWQLLEDFKAGPGVFLCAWCFAAATTATGINFAVVISQPGAVRTVREFEAHHVTILHRVPIIGVLGVDLKGGVGIAQPGASCHGTGDSTNTTSLKWVQSQANRSRNSLRDLSIYCVIKRTKIKLIELVRKVQCQKKDPGM